MIASDGERVALLHDAYSYEYLSTHIVLQSLREYVERALRSGVLPRTYLD